MSEASATTSVAQAKALGALRKDIVEDCEMGYGRIQDEKDACQDERDGWSLQGWAEHEFSEEQEEHGKAKRDAKHDASVFKSALHSGAAVVSAPRARCGKYKCATAVAQARSSGSGARSEDIAAEEGDGGQRSERVVKTALCPEAVVVFQDKNPKRRGAESFDRYEKYKCATSVAQAKVLGARPEDISGDYRKGFLRIRKEVEEEVREEAKEEGKEEVDPDDDDDDDDAKRAKRKAPGVKTTLCPEAAIVFQDENPKKRDSESFARYEKYKCATSVALAKAFGARPEDISGDYRKGFLRLADLEGEQVRETTQPRGSKRKGAPLATCSEDSSFRQSELGVPRLQEALEEALAQLDEAREQLAAERMMKRSLIHRLQAAYGS